MSVHSAKVIWVAGIAPKDLIHVDLGDAIRFFYAELEPRNGNVRGKPIKVIICGAMIICIYIYIYIYIY